MPFIYLILSFAFGFLLATYLLYNHYNTRVERLENEMMDLFVNLEYYKNKYEWKNPW